MTEIIQVMTAVDEKSVAAEISQQVVEERLASCVQRIGPIESTYWWNDEIEDAEEWLCLMKTHAGKYDELESFLQSIHPYDVPEILAVEMSAGNQAYLDWIAAEVKTK